MSVGARMAQTSAKMGHTRLLGSVRYGPPFPGILPQDYFREIATIAKAAVPQPHATPKPSWKSCAATASLRPRDSARLRFSCLLTLRGVLSIRLQTYRE